VFGVNIFQTVLIDLQAAKAGKASERAKGPKAWIREGTEEEPVDFLDPGVVQRVVGKFFYSKSLCNTTSLLGHYENCFKN